MNMMNNVIIEGNLVRDPEAGLTAQGVPFCKFSMAYNRQYKKKDEKEHSEEVSYFDVEVWSGLAEVCEKYLQKGRGVRVVGRLKQDRWTDTNGGSRSKVRIVGQQLDFMPGRQTSNEKKREEVKVF